MVQPRLISGDVDLMLRRIGCGHGLQSQSGAPKSHLLRNGLDQGIEAIFRNNSINRFHLQRVNSDNFVSIERGRIEVT